MNDSNSTQLVRAVEAIRIPSGESIHLPAGTSVVITQALGHSFTVLVPSQPGLYRIRGQDAGALGREEVADAAAPVGQPLEQAIWEQLRTCYDPEIPVNIVDLGLIYSLTIEPGGQGSKVAINMTLTAQGCGMGPILADEAQGKIARLPEVESVHVQLVWDPPWTPDRISPEGKQRLGIA
jgi:probable FeS assembly SUF system protein SufT